MYSVEKWPSIHSKSCDVVAKMFLSKFGHFSRFKGLTRKIKVKLNWKQANLHKLHNSSMFCKVSESYLEPSRIFAVEHFGENS